MDITLTPELEAYIAAKLKSGDYVTASEVVRDGLRLLAEQDELSARRQAWWEAEIQKGIDSANAGELMEGGTFFRALREEIDRYE